MGDFSDQEYDLNPSYTLPIISAFSDNEEEDEPRLTKEAEDLILIRKLRTSLTTAGVDQIEHARRLGLGKSILFDEMSNAAFEYDEPDDDSNCRRDANLEISLITFSKLIDKIICGDSDT
jgi:hypothetical protein